MSVLSAAPIEPERLTDLRRRAASRLTGSAASQDDTARAVDALSVLHALASSPETAPDALALLHELQVHQVELDLQAQELRESRAELEAALRRQTERYDHLPVGCFTIDTRLVLHELNQTGATMLGIGREEAHGLPFDTFLDADGARRLRSAMSSVAPSTPRASCGLSLSPRHGPEQAVVASIGADRAPHCYLLSLTPAGGEPPQPLPAS